MTVRTPSALLISRAQIRRLQTLWHRWTRRLKLQAEQSRELRHYYVELLSAGRAQETKQLTRGDASRVIARLERLARATEPKQNRAAGTAGRRGFPEQRRVRPNAAAWRALWACAAALGMDGTRLEHFVRSHYASVGLHGLGDLHTMADLNRVLWGLKAMLRRGPRTKRHPRATQRQAA